MEIQDRPPLIAAAWLHDIGYSPQISRTGFYPLDGARFLQNVGADARLRGLVAHHSAARVEAELRDLAKEIDAEFIREDSATADLMWYVGLTTGSGGERMTIEARLTEIAERYGPHDPVTLADIARVRTH